MLAQEVAKQVHRDAFTHFAEHPTNSLVHEVVRMMQMDFSIAQTPRRVSHLRGLPRTDHTHALLPEARTLGKVVEEFYLVVFVAKI